MSTPDELGWMFDWLNEVVVPYATKLKQNAIKESEPKKPVKAYRQPI